MKKDVVRLKTPDDIKRIREGGVIISEFFNLISRHSLEGMTTWELDTFADDFILKKKGRAAFKTRKDYNFASCISINNEAAHGFPMKKRLIKDGDIVKVDIGVVLNGYFADSCRTFTVGSVNNEAAKLVDACSRALARAIDLSWPDSSLGDIGHSICDEAEKEGFSVVKKFAGHGIGFSLHEYPRIPHYGVKGSGLKLPVGLVFTIEPIINAGISEVVKSPNNWTMMTADGSLSAQFEHTIAVTAKGPLVLTA